jgi:type VI secretion system protein ImpG
MEEKLLRHYRLELDFLRQLGIEFAEAHPDIAGHLGLPYQTGMDPHVERLREGFALLTARIRAKIEDEHPEITEALLGILSAEITQPIPSMSIVHFDVAADQWAPLAKGPVIESGVMLKTERTGNQPACEFRTTYPVTLWPLQIPTSKSKDVKTKDDLPQLSMQIDPADAHGTTATALLTIPIRCLGVAKLGQLDPRTFRTLRFYLGGEGRAPFVLRERLIHDVVRIEVREKTSRPDPKSIVLARNQTEARRIVLPVGFGRDQGVLPHSERSPLGYRNLREYFAFPQKYLFFDLDQLEKVISWGQSTGFDIRFFLKRAPEGVVIRDESIQLYCTPIINLFARACRVDRDEHRVEYAVEPPESREVSNREFFEIFSIDSVRSIDSARSSGSEYPRYDDLRPRPSLGRRTSWYARRRASIWPESKRSQVLLSFVDESMESGPPDDPMITVETTCTNLDLPTRLPSLRLQLQKVAPISDVQAVTPMTKAHPPPTAREYHWRLISQLALNHLPIGDQPSGQGKPWVAGRGTEVLREILRLHDPIQDETTRRQIDAIRHVESKHEFRSLPRDRRAVVGGVCVTIDFGEDAFAQRGLLLGEVIDQFLGQYVSINAYTRLIATVGQKKVKEWDPRAGDKILL